MSASLWLVALAAPASAIITRDDVPDSAYVVDDAEFPEVVDLFAPGDCLGTVIAPSSLLTVAHCAEDLAPGATLEVAGVDHEVSEVVLHPDWRWFPNDIAVVHLATPVDGVDPVPLYRGGDEDGRMIVLVGRGLHGTGLVGERGATDDARLRRATNVVTRATDQWLETVFDAPDDPDVTELEGVGAAGDSGGPAFLETGDGRFLAGMNSWGDAPRPVDLGKYGGRDYFTRVSRFVAWVDEVAGTGPPAPGGASPTEPTGPSGPSDVGGREPDVPAGTDGGRLGCGCGPASGDRGAAWVVAVLAVWRRFRRTQIRSDVIASAGRRSGPT